MNQQMKIMTTVQVQHDDALADLSPPQNYHPRYFDIVTVVPASDECTIIPSQNELSNFISIMSYEDTIINALHDLRDIKGSSIIAIMKYMQENFVQENFQGRNTTDLGFYAIKSSLFLLAMKSLLDRKIIVHTSCIKNGSACYKFSDEYKSNRSKDIKERLEKLEKVKAKTKGKNRVIHHNEKRLLPIRIKTIPMKTRLVDIKAVAIVKNPSKMGQCRMEMDAKRQRDMRLELPLKLGLHTDDMLFDKKRKSLREQMKIPRNKIFVTEIVTNNKRRHT